MNLPDYLDGIRLEHRVSRDDWPVFRPASIRRECNIAIYPTSKRYLPGKLLQGFILDQRGNHAY